MSLTKRNGFTLIEILIVIAIIAVLASLLLGAVMMVRNKGPEIKNRNDILQLSAAVDKFYSDHNGIYPPSRIRLCSNRGQYGASALDQASLQAINAIWPRIIITGINWDGTGTPNQNHTLEGDQCLVFFLGGIPSGGIPGGFSTDATDPSKATTDRKKTFTFEPGRLMLINRPGNNAGTVFPSYLDAFADNVKDATMKKPFVYFSSNRRENGYDPTPIAFPASSFAPAHSVSPYVQQNTGGVVKYWKSSVFQIISAGADGIFGPGGTTQTMPSVVQMPWPANSPPECKDDMTNFNTSKLGAPD